MRNSDPGSRATALVAGVVAAALIVTVLVVHATNLRALSSFHGFLHAGVVETLSFDSLPPENPFFAGRTISYYWFFHAVGAAISRSTGIDALHALEAIGLAGLFVLIAAAVSLGRHVYQSLGRGVFLAVLALVGGNPLGPWIAIRNWLERGGEFLPAQALYPAGSYGLTSQIGNVRYGPIFYFFFTMSSRGVALGLLLATVWALRRAQARPSAGTLAMVVAASALCTAMSPVIGIAGIGALCAAYLLKDGRAWRRDFGASGIGHQEESGTVTADRSWRLMLCMAAGVVVALPTFYHLFLVSQGGYGFVLFSRTGLVLILSVVVGAGPVLLLARPKVRWPGTGASDRRLLDTVLWAGLLLLVASFCLELPSDNNCNFYYAAMTILALPAAGYCGAAVRTRVGERRRWAEALGFLLFALPIPFVVHVFTGRAPIALSLSEGRINRSADEWPDMAKMYRWIADNSPRDAVVVIDPDRKVAVSGNMPELPAMAGRPLFVGAESYMTQPYAGFGKRRIVARRLLRGERLGPEQVAALESLGRPIYLLIDEQSQAGRPALEEQFGRPVFAAGEMALFLWRAPSSGEPPSPGR